MAASYAFTRIVRDVSRLLSYVQDALPSASSATNNGTTLTITTSPALTVAQAGELDRLIMAYADPQPGKMDSTMDISVHNSTSAPLAADGVFTGTWEDISRCSSVVVTSLSDRASAPSGLQFHLGIVSRQADVTRSYTTSESTAHSYNLPLTGFRYLRVSYRNAQTAQTTLSLQVRWSVAQVSTTVTGTDRVDDALPALLTRSMVVGKQGIGTYREVPVDEYGMLRTPPRQWSSPSCARPTTLTT